MSFVTIRIEKDGVAGITRSALGDVGRAAVRRPALLWWRKFLPIHFTNRASNRYGYAPRSGEPGSGRAFRGSYSEAKLKRKKIAGVQAIGEVKPLVWSGRSRERATSSPNIETVAQNFRSFEARVILDVPALNFKPRLREELIADYESEIQAMNRSFDRAFELELNKLGRTRHAVKTIRG